MRYCVGLCVVPKREVGVESSDDLVRSVGSVDSGSAAEISGVKRELVSAAHDFTNAKSIWLPWTWSNKPRGRFVCEMEWVCPEGHYCKEDYTKVRACVGRMAVVVGFSLSAVVSVVVTYSKLGWDEQYCVCLCVCNCVMFVW